MPAPLPPTIRLPRCRCYDPAAARPLAVPLAARPAPPPPARSDTCSGAAADPASPAWDHSYRPGPGGPAEDHPLRARAAGHYRQEHPTWGAGYIRRPPGRWQAGTAATMPSECHLRSGGSAASGIRPRRPGGDRRRPRDGPPPRMTPGRWTPWSSCAPADGQGVCWLRLVVSLPAPSWAPRFSPHYYWAHVPEAEVQRRLRRAFECRGLPRSLRVDNGKPWGSWSDLPPPLALWLIGLGVAVIWNDPPAAAERRGGAVAGDGQAVGRAARVPRPGGAAGPPGRGRPAAAGAVSAGAGAKPLGAVPRAGARRPPLPRGGRGRRRGACSRCATTWRRSPCRAGWTARGKSRSITGISMWGSCMRAGKSGSNSTPGAASG